MKNINIGWKYEADYDTGYGEYSAEFTVTAVVQMEGAKALSAEVEVSLVWIDPNENEHFEIHDSESLEYYQDLEFQAMKKAEEIESKRQNEGQQYA